MQDTADVIPASSGKLKRLFFKSGSASEFTVESILPPQECVNADKSSRCTKIIDFWYDFLVFSASDGKNYLVEDYELIYEELLKPYKCDRIFNGSDSESYVYEPELSDLEDWQLKEFCDRHKKLWKTETE